MGSSTLSATLFKMSTNLWFRGDVQGGIEGYRVYGGIEGYWGALGEEGYRGLLGLGRWGGGRKSLTLLSQRICPPPLYAAAKSYCVP